MPRVSTNAPSPVGGTVQHMTEAAPFRLWDQLDSFEAAVSPGEYARGWGDLYDTLTNDPAEAVVVRELSAILRQDGRFREPLIVEEGVLRDGRHRWCAHKHTGIVPITTSGWGGIGSGRLVRVTYRIDGEVNGAMPLRSFPVGATWVSADVAATTSSGPGWTVETYTYMSDDADPADVARAGVARGATLGYVVEVLGHETGSSFEE